LKITILQIGPFSKTIFCYWMLLSVSKFIFMSGENDKARTIFQ